jgi:quinol monooxygenase YgiN
MGVLLSLMPKGVEQVVQQSRLLKNSLTGRGGLAWGPGVSVGAARVPQSGAAHPPHPVDPALDDFAVREPVDLHLARQEAAATRAEDAGCLTYTFLQQSDAPCEFVLYEQWRDQAALDAHLARLDRSIGLRALFDFFEKTQSLRYEVVA